MTKSFPKALENLNHRWLRPSHLEQFWPQWSASFQVEQIGESYEGRPLRVIKIGQGKTRVLIWSQMHGNEPTATLSLCDLLDFLIQDEQKEFLRSIEENLSLAIIPMLNPDGSERFTRRNAQGIDLNRDCIDQASPEMQAYFKFLKEFDPHWGLNLHDQRSIFSAGKSGHTATLSFLAPSGNVERSITNERKQSMDMIGRVFSNLKNDLEGHFGRYTDEFYPLALGDNLMQMKVPNILLEAGAYRQDPNRSIARTLISKFFVVFFLGLMEKGADKHDYSDRYWDIPENRQLLRDIIIRRADLGGVKVDISLQLKEEVREGVFFQYYIVDDLGDLSGLKGIEEWQGGLVETDEAINPGEKAHFRYQKKSKFYNGILQEC